MKDLTKRRQTGDRRPTRSHDSVGIMMDLGLATQPFSGHKIGSLRETVPVLETKARGAQGRACQGQEQNTI
jgi:hypothetical protein